MLLKNSRNRDTSSRKIAIEHNKTRHLYASVEAYRCLVLLGLIATFRLRFYRFVQFVLVYVDILKM